MSGEMEHKLKLDVGGVSLFQELVKDCPTATNEEMKKLLSVQSVMLTALSGKLSQELIRQGSGKVDKGVLKLLLAVTREIRATAETVTRIDVSPEVGSDSDLDRTEDV